MAKHKHLGSNFDDFLREEGILEEVEAGVKKRCVRKKKVKIACLQTKSDLKDPTVAKFATVGFFTV